MKNGRKLQSLSIDGKSYPLFLKFQPGFLKDIDQLKSYPIRLSGRVYSLSNLGKIERKYQNDIIFRENGKEIVKITGNIGRGKEAGLDKALKSLKQKFNKEKSDFLGDNVTASFEDSKEVLTNAMDQLKVSMLLSLLLVFLVLSMQFQNFKSPLVVMFAIPMGLIGVLSSLYIFGSNLSLNSVLGIILLNGIAVNNSILIVDFSNSLFEKGASANFAVLEAARKRLRPILITSLTTILGMLPIALGMGDGGKILQPLGIAVSGGLPFLRY